MLIQLLRVIFDEKFKRSLIKAGRKTLSVALALLMVLSVFASVPEIFTLAEAAATTTAGTYTVKVTTYFKNGNITEGGTIQPKLRYKADNGTSSSVTTVNGASHSIGTNSNGTKTDEFTAVGFPVGVTVWSKSNKNFITTAKMQWGIKVEVWNENTGAYVTLYDAGGVQYNSENTSGADHAEYNSCVPSSKYPKATDIDWSPDPKQDASTVAIPNHATASVTAECNKAVKVYDQYGVSYKTKLTYTLYSGVDDSGNPTGSFTQDGISMNTGDTPTITVKNAARDWIPEDGSSRTLYVRAGAGSANSGTYLWPVTLTQYSFTVNYNLNAESGGTTTPSWNENGTDTGVKSENVIYAKKLVNVPDKAYRTGYVFSGIFDTKAATGGNQVKNNDARQKPNAGEDVTYYARWEPIANPVEFYNSDGQLISRYGKDNGAKFDSTLTAMGKPADPAYPGKTTVLNGSYQFTGWVVWDAPTRKAAGVNCEGMSYDNYKGSYDRLDSTDSNQVLKFIATYKFVAGSGGATKQYTVTFKDAGGQSLSAETGAYWTKFDIPEYSSDSDSKIGPSNGFDIAHFDYHFAGWTSHPTELALYKNESTGKFYYLDGTEYKEYFDSTTSATATATAHQPAKTATIRVGGEEMANCTLYDLTLNWGEAESAEYQPGDTSRILSSDVTYYPCYSHTVKQCNITKKYYTINASGSPTTTTATFRSDATALGKTFDLGSTDPFSFNRSGFTYTFRGWKKSDVTVPYGTETADIKYAGGKAEFTIEDDVTYFAIYEKSEIKYNAVYYNYDGSKILESYENLPRFVEGSTTQKVTYTLEDQFQGEAPVRERENMTGYKFVGWTEDVTKTLNPTADDLAPATYQFEEQSKAFYAAYYSFDYYQVLFLSGDGWLLQGSRDYYTYGDEIHNIIKYTSSEVTGDDRYEYIPIVKNKESGVQYQYTFMGWKSSDEEDNTLSFEDETAGTVSYALAPGEGNDITVTANKVYTAVFKKEIREYKISLYPIGTDLSKLVINEDGYGCYLDEGGAKYFVKEDIIYTLSGEEYVPYTGELTFADLIAAKPEALTVLTLKYGQNILDNVKTHYQTSGGVVTENNAEVSKIAGKDLKIVPYGETEEQCLPYATDQYSYSFNGWAPAINPNAEVRGDRNFVATYKTDNVLYKVHWFAPTGFDSSEAAIDYTDTAVTYRYKRAISTPAKTPAVNQHPVKDNYVWSFLGWYECDENKVIKTDAEGNEIKYTKGTITDPGENHTKEFYYVAKFGFIENEFVVRLYDETKTTLLGLYNGSYGSTVYLDNIAKDPTGDKHFTLSKFVNCDDDSKFVTADLEKDKTEFIISDGKAQTAYSADKKTFFDGYGEGKKEVVTSGAAIVNMTETGADGETYTKYSYKENATVKYAYSTDGLVFYDGTGDDKQVVTVSGATPVEKTVDGSDGKKYTEYLYYAVDLKVQYEEEAHNWPEARVEHTVLPNYKDDGTDTYICSCGYTKTETVPKLVDVNGPIGRIAIRSYNWTADGGEEEAYIRADSLIAIMAVDCGENDESGAPREGEGNGIKNITYTWSNGAPGGSEDYDEFEKTTVNFDIQVPQGDDFDEGITLEAVITDWTDKTYTITTGGLYTDKTKPVLDLVTTCEGFVFAVDEEHPNRLSVTLDGEELAAEKLESYKIEKSAMTEFLSGDSVLANTVNAYLAKNYGEGSTPEYVYIYKFDKVEEDDKITLVDPGEYIITVADKAGNTVTEKFTLTNEHEWNDGKVAKEATCTEDGEMKYTCNICGATKAEVIKSEGHKWNADFTVDTPASCTENGSKSIHCQVCDEKKEVTVIPSPGHDYTVNEQKATCKAAGYKITTCKNCSYYEYVGYEKLTHEINLEAEGADEYGWIVGKAATCTAKGYKYQLCSLCKEQINKTDIEIIAHDFKEITPEGDYCFDKEGGKEYHLWKCNDCGYSYVVNPELEEHDLGEPEVKAATCTENEVDTYTCTRCDKEISEEIRLSYLEHNWAGEYTVDIPATCVTDGQKSIHCLNTGCEETKDVTVIPATGHHFVKDEANSVAATCHSDGLLVEICDNENCRIIKGYRKADDTDDTEDLKAAPDEEYTVAVTVPGPATKETVIPKETTTHTWDEGTETKPATCTEKGEKIHKCTDPGCEETDVVEIPMLAHEKSEKVLGHTDATCKEYEKTVYKCKNCEDGTVTEYGTVYAAHSAGTLVKTLTKATCMEKGEGIYKCSVCSVAFKKEIPAIGSHSYTEKVTTPATCTTAGEKTFTCSVCDDSYTEPVEALGHIWNAKYEGEGDEKEFVEYIYTVDTEPTCTAVGFKAIHCTVCDAVKGESGVVIEALGHDIITLEAVPATCTKAGLTEGEACSRCDHVEVAQETIPVVAHTKGEYIKTNKAATCTENGEDVYKCSVCLDTFTVVTENPDAHNWGTWGDWSETSAPTCTEKGQDKATRQCLNGCGTVDEKTREKDALGHKMILDYVGEPVTEGNKTIVTTYYKCEREGCDYTEHEDAETTLCVVTVGDKEINLINGEKLTEEKLIAALGSLPTKAAEPEEDGAYSIVWKIDGEKAALPAEVTENVTVTYDFEFVPNTYKIAFYNYAGKLISEKAYTKDESVDVPEDIFVTGYKFFGWTDGENNYKPEEIPAVTLKFTEYSARVAEDTVTVYSLDGETFYDGVTDSKGVVTGVEYASPVVKTVEVDSVVYTVYTYKVEEQVLTAYSADGGLTFYDGTGAGKKTVDAPYATPVYKTVIFGKDVTYRPWLESNDNYKTFYVTFKDETGSKTIYTAALECRKDETVTFRLPEDLAEPTKDSNSVYHYIFNAWLDKNGNKATFPVELGDSVTYKASFTYKKHDESKKILSVSPATCTKAEITKYQCAKCGYEWEAYTSPATDHHYIEISRKVDGNITTITYRCTNCPNEYTRTVTTGAGSDVIVVKVTADGVAAGGVKVVIYQGSQSYVAVTDDSGCAYFSNDEVKDNTYQANITKDGYTSASGKLVVKNGTGVLKAEINKVICRCGCHRSGFFGDVKRFFLKIFRFFSKSYTCCDCGECGVIH